MPSSTNTTPSSRPSFIRSKTMPAFRRTLSLTSIEKPLALLRDSSRNGLRRLSSFGKSSTSTSSTSTACASTECIPVFTIPNYAKPSAAPPTASISPLTRPSFKRAMTMPAPVRALRSTALVKLPALKVCERRPKLSADSVASAASFQSSCTSTSTVRRRRSSSVSSIESFTSTEDRVTLALQLRALPSTMTGVLASLVAVLLILLLPALAVPTPKRTPLRRPYEREIILTEEQEQNPPRLPLSPTLPSRLSRRMEKAYRRTLRRAACAERASTPSEALTTFFAPRPKLLRAATPVPVDPKTLASDIPLVVYSSPIALPLPKGPAPAVEPARKARRKLTVLPTVKEERLDDALCAGW
ncbi:hypothetical protein MVEN_01336700 [Mycena venus]|uniref:Uncharacterized protein n=1 Tax=Mycena venus TaxID=2733690 RepID=A0A8H7CW35_9AGAR|nr:hypothetical protein MVEN_01336700 [Mycena venus]